MSVLKFTNMFSDTISLTNGVATATSQYEFGIIYSWSVQSVFTIPVGITSLSVVLELSLDGTNWATFDTQTLTASDNILYTKVGSPFKSLRWQLTSDADGDVAVNANIAALTS